MGILETILPVITISFVGYLATSLGHLSQRDNEAISKFVFTYLVPMLLFIGTANADLPDNMQWGFLLSFYLSAVIVYGLGVLAAKYYFNYTSPQQATFAMGGTYSNATIIGIPVCMFALGEQALLPLFIIISIHNLILFSMGILVAERDRLSLSTMFLNIWLIIKQLLSHPITLSLVLGGLVNIFDIVLYAPFEKAISMLGEAAVPAALFILGASLKKYRISGNITPAIWMAVMKTILMPALVAVFAFLVFELDPLWASTALLCASMPVGVNAYIFSIKYQVCEASVATAIVISTLGALITLSLVLAFLHTVVPSAP